MIQKNLSVRSFSSEIFFSSKRLQDKILLSLEASTEDWDRVSEPPRSPKTLSERESESGTKKRRVKERERERESWRTPVGREKGKALERERKGR